MATGTFKSFEIILTAPQACLFSRLVLSYTPRKGEESLLCISPNHIAAYLSFDKPPAIEVGSKRFFEPEAMKYVRWRTLTIRESAALQSRNGELHMSYAGANEDENSYYSHLVRVQPELDPLMAVRSRVTLAINKAMKNASSRKRNRELAYLAIRKAKVPMAAMQGLQHYIQSELTYLPEEVLATGLQLFGESLRESRRN